MSRTLTRVAIAALVLLGLGTSGIICQRIAARGRYAVPYSTYGAGPAGTKGLFVYAEEAGLSPTRWAEDLVGLEPGGLLVAIGGCEQAPNRSLSRYEASELSAWIASGGVLLVAGAHDYLWDDAGVALDPPHDCFPDGSLAAELAQAERGEAPDLDLSDGSSTDPEAIIDRLLGVEEEQPPVLAMPSGILAGLPPVPLVSPGTITTTDADAEVFLSIGKPSVPLGVVVRRGEGAIIVVTSASLFQNRDLALSDGGVVFARLHRALAVRGPVIFDEYHLGVGERRSLGRYVRDLGGGPVVLQLLFLVVAALLAMGVRFGRPVRAAPTVPGGTASFVDGIGDLYARTGDAGAALSLVAKHALDEIAAHHHVPNVDVGRLAALLTERGSRDAASAVVRLAELSAGVEIRGRQLVEHVSEIDGLLARAKGSDR